MLVIILGRWGEGEGMGGTCNELEANKKTHWNNLFKIYSHDLTRCNDQLSPNIIKLSRSNLLITFNILRM